MNMLKKAVAASAFACVAFAGTTAWSADAPKKNWTPPSHKIYAQTLVDGTMKKHPELLSVTFHGTPPGTTEVYTMFAGSFPDRIGNTSSPDDVDVIKKGITILDPRWHRADDNPKKFVILVPLRDASGENVGLAVYAFKEPAGNVNTSAAEKEYFAKAASLRDELAPRISSYKALFNAAE